MSAEEYELEFESGYCDSYWPVARETDESLLGISALEGIRGIDRLAELLDAEPADPGSGRLLVLSESGKRYDLIELLIRMIEFITERVERR